MSDELLSLEPKNVWYYFNEICKIPHGTCNEAGIRNFIKAEAEKHGLKYHIDEIGNIVVYKNGSGKYKNAKPIIIQCHIDMVCVAANGFQYDPVKDPIKPEIEDGWVIAKNTTLGADDGTGVAMALALFNNKQLQMGPIEFLFTVMEEKSLDGAFALKEDVLHASSLINIDSPEDHIAFIGCGGGYGLELKLPVKNEAVPGDYVGLKISISGLKGGHSALVVTDQRGNSNKIMARILFAVRQKYDLLLSEINGGTKHNVLPSETQATIAVKKDNLDQVKAIINDQIFKIGNELSIADPDLKICLEDVAVKESIGLDASKKLTAFLNAAPSGLVTMSYEIEGLVQTSTNLATIKTEKSEIMIKFLTRSSSKTEMEAVNDNIRAHAELLGVKAEHFMDFPAWQPNLNSPLLGLMRRTYMSLFDSEMKPTGTHAGLECGVIKSKYPNMDMVSIGANTIGFHQVGEKVEIKSVEKSWTLLTKTLENFAKGR